MQTSTKRFKTEEGFEDSTEETWTVVCREKQYNELYTKLYDAITTQTPTHIFVSGKSGTGKSVTINQVLKDLQRNKRVKQLFQLISANGMSCSSITYICKLILAELGVKRYTRNIERQLFNTVKRGSGTDNMILLVFDEIDCLSGKGENVRNFIQLLFRLPFIENSRIILLSISNIIDLAQNIIDDPNISYSSLLFPPYQKDEIKEILRQHFSAEQYEETAFELCARQGEKVGDVRKAIGMMRASMQNGVATLQRTVVTSSNLNQSTTSFRALPHQQKIVLAVALGYAGDDNPLPISKHYAAYRSILTDVGLDMINQADFYEVFKELQLCHFLVLEGKKSLELKRLVRFTITADQLTRHLNEFPEIQHLMTHRPQASWKLSI